MALNDQDSTRLLFLWYKDVAKKDFSLVTYRQKRLPFGLRCSPFILMMALYRILCVDSAEDDHRLKAMKYLMFALMYVDNGAVSGTSDDVNYAYNKLKSIFSPYKIEVQQLTTNDTALQNVIDENEGVTTETNVKLLGLNWNREEDTISTKRLNLNPEATTKRLILSTIAQQYDIYGFQAPLLVRARLFLHALQCNQSISWDEKLSNESLKEWRKITKQANAAPAVQVKRCIGDRSGEYELLAYTDASKNIYAAVLYLRDVSSGKISFVCAKNRIVNSQLQTKTIPSLELQAVTLGVECVVDLKNELSGNKCIVPINIVSCRLFTDSLITLHWLNSYNHKLDKMQKRSVFVLNRLEFIAKQCSKVPITFCFTSTNANPADCVTRPCSYKQFLKSSFITGELPPVSDEPCWTTDFQVTVPDPGLSQSPDVQMTAVQLDDTPQLIPPDKYSSFKKLVRVTFYVMKFIQKLKQKVHDRNTDKFADSHVTTDCDLHSKAYRHVLLTEQKCTFPDIFDYLLSDQRKLKEIPSLVSRLNIFIDKDGLLKVKSKFGRNYSNSNYTFPILLSKDSTLTKLIIKDTHLQLAHCGCYSVLADLRKKFWIQHPFTSVKRVLKECLLCRRFNARTVKLTQNSYRNFRTNPPCEPYRSIFIDYIGPYYVKTEGTRHKVWLLAITCLWSRSVNLKVCTDMTVKSFMRSFQMHVFEHGMPTKIMSDLGSQLVAGANIISDHLNSVESKTFLAENGIHPVKFEQYFKGNSALGSLIEICVKLTKRLIYGAIKKTVLCREDFDFIVAQAVSLINKRPIAFKDSLRGEAIEMPEPITPELLVYGREIVTPNLIPALETEPEDQWTPKTDPNDLAITMSKLRKTRKNLIETYNKEFLQNLLTQATNLKDRYKPVSHAALAIGDIIMLKENHLKSADYPLARVTKIIRNDIGEVTNVIAFKGKTCENVKRHVTSVIPIMRMSSECATEAQPDQQPPPQATTKPPERAAKLRSKARTRAMLQNLSS